ncbi:MAG: ParB N-terminal domain-containing protein [Nitrospirota bacterium]|nr:MAG: ParB N-terminal domain-containing protein [Nitrospirota bacterium]
MAGSETLRTGDILIDKSIFSLENVLVDLSDHTQLISSFASSGVLAPLTVFRDAKGGYHVVDGFKRARYLRDSGNGSLTVYVLPDDVSLRGIIQLILHSKWKLICESAVNRASFVAFVVASGLDEGSVLKDVCRPLGLKPGRKFIEECKRISEMNDELKRYCHEKKLAMKQLVNFINYPEEVLSHILSWRQRIQLSASIMDEIASGIRDLIRRNDMKLSDLTSDGELNEALNSDSSQKERTERLRTVLRKKRFPLLTEVNSRLEQAIERTGLPDNINISWDRTLENRGLSIRIDVRATDDIRNVKQVIGSEELPGLIKEILDEL